MKKRQEVLLFAVGAVLLLVVAFSVRMHSLPVAMMLGDSAGPWLVAWGDPWSGHAHAPLYGWGLLVPYRLALGVSGSLWEAVSVLQVFHALVAPLAFLLVLILRPGAWIAATLAGLALALDGGLLDTARSGSETYLGALWVGLILLGRLKASTRWGPTVAWWAFAMAVMNHPLAVCAAPFLLGLPLRSRPGLIGVLVGALLLLPHGYSLLRQDLGGSGGLSLGVIEAFDAWLREGRWMAWVLLLAPFLAIRGSKTRWIGATTLMALLLMVMVGAGLGYLRDHHIRLLSVPMALCLAAVPGLWALVLFALLRLNWAPLPPPGTLPRPGTLGMSTGLVSEIESLEIAGPLQIDGAWLSGGLVAEPSALLLDLHLRGRPLEDLRAGGSLVLLLSAERGQLGRGAPDSRVSAGDFHWLMLDPDLSTLELCEPGQKLGGAWDFFSLAHPTDGGGPLMDWMPNCEGAGAAR